MRVPLADLHFQYASIKDEIDRVISSVIAQSAFIGAGGNPFVIQFENDFSKYIGVKHCIGCANGTDSMEILLKAFGIGSGDEVLVPAFSWISTSEAVNNANARPVFIDVDPATYTIDVNRIEEKITPKTKAIIPVHLYGLPAEMDEIMTIARKYNLIVIEDCAQAHGAEYKGKKVGLFGHASSFSFYPGKNLGAYGDAGCMVTNDDSIAKTCRMIANHGQLTKHDHRLIGRNSRLDGIQAAVLTAKLKHLDTWNDHRIKNATAYSSALQNTGLQLQACPNYSKHVYHIFSIYCSGQRDRIAQSLNRNGIQTAVHYPKPLPSLHPYHHIHSDFNVASSISSNILSLPMYPELGGDAIRFICETIHTQLDGKD